MSGLSSPASVRPVSVSAEDQVDGLFRVVTHGRKGLEISLGQDPSAQPEPLRLIDQQDLEDLARVADAGLGQEVVESGLLTLAPETPITAGRGVLLSSDPRVRPRRLDPG
jgi:hypothetical protein